MKARDLLNMTDDELDERLRERKQALQAFRLQSVTGTVDNVRAARNARRDIARILTIQNQRTRAALAQSARGPHGAPEKGTR